MADQKITQLTELTSTAATDVLPIVDVAGDGSTKKVKVSNLVPTFVENEIVSGSGTSWTLANTPISGSVKVWSQGVRLYLGSDPNFGYSISGTTITTQQSYSAGDMVADYRK